MQSNTILIDRLLRRLMCHERKGHKLIAESFRNVLLKLSCAYTLLGDLVKNASSDLVGLDCCLRVCISHKLAARADNANPESHLE